MTTDEPVPVLDDQGKVQSLDRRNMLRLVNDLPEQCETALGIGRSFVVELLEEKPNVVFISGVGESGLAGDMVAVVAGEEMQSPIVSDHGGRLPRYVGDEALVFVVDYAGKSETAMQAYKDARMRGAKLICVTSGGKLLEAASRDGVATIKIPPGQPPRSAIGYLFVPIIAAIEKMGLANGLTEKVSFGIKLMKNVREAFRFEHLSGRNIAKQTAEALFGNVVVVYGAAGYRAVVAERWKRQISANSKSLAFASTFPGVADADISGWELAERQCKNCAIVMLNDSQNKTEIPALMSASKELLEAFSVVEVEMQGYTTAEKLLYGTYMADYVSCYLALLNNVNPTVTENVTFVESRLFGVEPEEPTSA